MLHSSSSASECHSKESVAAARAALQRVAVCLPRIIKPNEDRLWQLRSRSSIVTSLLPESQRLGDSRASSGADWHFVCH